MLVFTAILLDGLTYSAWLFMIAVGLTLIFGVMRILNIAHGAFYAIGAYVCASALGIYYANGNDGLLAFLVIALSAVISGAIVGLLIEKGVLRVLYGRDEVVMVLLTYALFLILEDAIKLVWGVESYFVYQPYAYFGFVEINGLPYQIYDLLLVAVSFIVGLALWAWLSLSRSGKLMKAVVADKEISSAMGINVNYIFTLTFIIGTILATLGGALTAPKIAVSPGIGVEVIILAFAVVVIGGLGSITGAAIGAILAGYARAMSVHLAPEFELFAIYAVMALVLAIKPYGLFPATEGRKI